MQKINELELAKKLIKFPSITPVDAGIIKFLEKKLKNMGFKIKILEFNCQLLHLLSTDNMTNIVLSI